MFSELVYVSPPIGRPIICTFTRVEVIVGDFLLNRSRNYVPVIFL